MSNPTDTSITTGVDVLRSALAARNKKFHLGNLARDADIGLAQLNNFIDGKSIPRPEQLQALTREVYAGHVVLDLERNLLKSAYSHEPKSIGTVPQIDYSTWPKPDHGW